MKKRGSGKLNLIRWLALKAGIFAIDARNCGRVDIVGRKMLLCLL